MTKHFVEQQSGNLTYVVRASRDILLSGRRNFVRALQELGFPERQRDALYQACGVLENAFTYGGIIDGHYFQSEKKGIQNALGKSTWTEQLQTFGISLVPQSKLTRLFSPEEREELPHHTRRNIKSPKSVRVFDANLAARWTYSVDATGVYVFSLKTDRTNIHAKKMLKEIIVAGVQILDSEMDKRGYKDANKSGEIVIPYDLLVANCLINKINWLKITSA